MADVLQLRGRRGWLSPPLVRVSPGTGPVLGTAVTVRLVAATGGPGLAGLHEVLSGALDGRVLVLAGADGVEGAVFGEILGTAARRRGAVAAVVGGRVRDRAALVASGWPVWALGEATAGPGGRAHVAEVGGPVVVGGVAVTDGDVVVVDDGGVVALPLADAGDVLVDAAAYAAAESAVMADLGAGLPLTMAYRHKRDGVERLRAGWRR